jgi:hypothetical protein
MQAIKEDRTIVREKYSEIKLQGQFLRVSPGYPISTPGNLSTTKYSNNEAIAITPLTNEDNGAFYVVRHADYTSTYSTTYKLKLPTTAGTLTIPQLGGSLSLHGRDSKIHLVDYPVGAFELLYSTAEVFTWKKFGDKTVLVLYGGPDELHEAAVKKASNWQILEGEGVEFKKKSNVGVFQWKTSTKRRVIQTSSLIIYLLGKFLLLTLNSLTSRRPKFRIQLLGSRFARKRRQFGVWHVHYEPRVNHRQWSTPDPSCCYLRLYLVNPSRLQLDGNIGNHRCAKEGFALNGQRQAA